VSVVGARVPRAEFLTELIDRDGQLRCHGMKSGHLVVQLQCRGQQQAVSREAGLINVRPEGASRISTLHRDDLDALYRCLLDSVLTAPH